MTRCCRRGTTVNLWGRNSDKWFTSRRWRITVWRPTPRRRAFSFRSHLPRPERNKLGLPSRRRVSSLPPSPPSHLRTPFYGFAGNVARHLRDPAAPFPRDRVTGEIITYPSAVTHRRIFRVSAHTSRLQTTAGVWRIPALSLITSSIIILGGSAHLRRDARAISQGTADFNELGSDRRYATTIGDWHWPVKSKF